MSFAFRILQTPDDRVLEHKALAKAAPLWRRRQPKIARRSQPIPPEKSAAGTFCERLLIAAQNSSSDYTKRRRLCSARTAGSQRSCEENRDGSWQAALFRLVRPAKDENSFCENQIIFLEKRRNFVMFLSTSCNVFVAERPANHRDFLIGPKEHHDFMQRETP